MSLDRLLKRAESAPLNWNAVTGGKRAWICFDNDETYDLGPDPTGARFQKIAERMVTGHYYPPHAIQFFGKFRDEGRDLKVGDRVLQRIPLLGVFGLKQGPAMASAVELYIVERTSTSCEIGYVTTEFHLGRGIWSAKLQLEKGSLSLRVQSTTSPQSWLYWTALPVARWMQTRAWKCAVKEFRKC